MRYGLCAALLLALAAAGCDSKKSEVPKNPVPMEKPGQGASPQGAQPDTKPQALPK
jgi:hypothetical protein